MTQNNVKIAITGGICSGKSTVAKIIEEQGYKVFSCDKIYTELLSDRNFVKFLAEEFGEKIIRGGTLNRTALSEIVFANKGKLKKLNELTHPKIMQAAIERMQGAGIFFCEVPLLFEGGFESLFDNAIVVLRDRKTRTTELMQRTGIDANQANLRINNQFNYDNHNFTKYYVIHNDDNLVKLKQSILLVLEKIKQDYM